MVSPTETDTIRSKYLQEIWDHDPGTTAATLVSPDGGTTVRSIDMREFSDFSVSVVTTVLGGTGVTKIEIVAADDAALSTNLVVIKNSGALVMDALGDWAIETCTLRELAQESSDADANSRYIGGRITCNNAGDEAIVHYFAIPNRPQLNLTAQTTIS